MNWKESPAMGTTQTNTVAITPKLPAILNARIPVALFASVGWPVKIHHHNKECNHVDKIRRRVRRTRRQAG